MKKNIIELLPTGYQSLNEKDQIVEINRIWLEKLGYKKTEVIGRHLSVFLSQKSKKIFNRKFPLFAKKGNIIDQELTFVCKNGKKLRTFVDGKVEYDKNNNFVKTHCILKDVTERMDAEFQLKHREHELSMIFENSKDLLILAELNENNKYQIKKINNPFIGKTKEWEEILKNIVGMDLEQFWKTRLKSSGRDIKTRLKSLSHGMTKKKTIIEEFQMNIDNKVFYYVETVIPIVEDNGDCSHVLLSIRDVSQKRLAALALKESEDKFEEVIHSISDHIYVSKINNTGDIENIYISPNVKDITGYPSESFVNNWSFWGRKVIVKKDHKIASEQFNKLKKGKFSECEYRIIKKDGTQIWVRDSAKATHDDDGCIMIYGLVSDITKKKLTEIKLRDSEVKYRGIFEHSELGIFQSVVAGRFLSANNAVAKMFGYKNPKDLIKQITDIPTEVYVNHEDRKKIISEVEDGKSGVFEVKFKRKDGSEFIGKLFVRKVLDQNNKFIYMEGFIEDITKQKKIELLNKTYADIVKSIPSGMFIYRYKKPNKLILIDGNAAAERLTNLKIKDWIGKEFNEIWPNAKKKGVTQSFLKVMKTGKIYQTEDLYYEDEKISGGFKIITFKLPGERLAVAFEDITANKQAEAALVESETYLRSLIEAAPYSITVSDLDGKIIDCNEKSLSLLKYNRKSTLIGKNMIDIVAKHDRRRAKRDFNELLKSGIKENAEINVIDKYGRIIPVQISNKIISDFENNPKAILSIANDITERKQNEMKVKQLSHQIITAHEDEKQRISRELHDSLAQHLALIKIQFQIFSDKLNINKREVSQFIPVLDDMLNKTRDLIEDLRPDILYDLGLVAAISDMATRLMDRYKIYIKINLPNIENYVNKDEEIHVYRIVQEAFQNAVKHSNATTIELSTTVVTDTVDILIKDNGRGFDVERVNHRDDDHYSHLGLAIMRERAQSLKANLIIESEPGQGSTMILSLKKLVLE